MKITKTHSNKKDYAIYVIIFLCLFIALIPVILSNNYLRQDDLKTGIWWGMRMKEEGYLYYNTMLQIVRPVCMVLFFLIDLISIDMHYAVYVRLLSIVTVGFLGILVYNWQLKFNSNRVLAASFSIASFTLPGIQLFSATANYFLIIFGLVPAIAAGYCWHRAFMETSAKKVIQYNFIGYALFMMSLFDYPLTSMYVWVLAAICYVNTLRISSFTPQRNFVYYLGRQTFYMMVAYFIFIKFVHAVLHVQLDQNSAVINFAHFATKLTQPFIMFVVQSYLWFYEPLESYTSYAPPIFIISSCFLAFLRIHYTNKNGHIFSAMMRSLINLAGLAILFVLAYLPILALPDMSYTFRYTIATMPMIMYLLFWSVNENICVYQFKNLFLSKAAKTVCSILLISTSIFGIYYANLMVSDGIVGPQTHDFNFIEQQLREKALPYLEKNQRFAIHVIDCDHGNNYKFEKDVPFILEYGMRLCVFPNHLIGAINHSLMSLGYTSNFRRPNTVVTEGDEIIMTDVPWGYLVLSSNLKLTYQEPNTPIITIDMREAGLYQHLDFYKNLLGMKK